ncbi:MAG: VanZ family protein [Ghiorsea sp.]
MVGRIFSAIEDGRTHELQGTHLYRLHAHHQHYRDAIVLAAYCAFIFYLSHQSTLPTVMTFPHQDKLVHATAYAVMAALAWRFLAHHMGAARSLFFACLLFCSAYGMSDEYHQSFIQGRDADVWDWLADTLGAALLLGTLLLRKQRGGSCSQV